MTDTDTAAAPAPGIPLAARINGARAWTPDKARTSDVMITGTVVAIVPRTSEYGTYPVVVLQTSEDHAAPFEAFHAFHTVALEQLKALRPEPGEKICIVAHPVVKARKRTDAKGDPVEYAPYTIFNPDADQTVASGWSWDDAGDAPGDTPGF
jgi:hypothetical protein